jgi:hypothetical protein
MEGSRTVLNSPGGYLLLFFGNSISRVKKLEQVLS